MSTRVSIRGRKREARRWREAVLARIGLRPILKRFPIYHRALERLGKRDPALYLAVDQCILDDEKKWNSLTREQQLSAGFRRVDLRYDLQREFVCKRFGLARWYSEFKRLSARPLRPE